MEHRYDENDPTVSCMDLLRQSTNDCSHLMEILDQLAVEDTDLRLLLKTNLRLRAIRSNLRLPELK